MEVSFHLQTAIVSLETGFTQHSLPLRGNGYYVTEVFSPDGAYFVTAGIGKANVFDSETGEEVRTFVETEKVASRHGARDHGFLDTALRFGKNLVGRFVTDSPGPPRITVGFSEGGEQLITLAEGQILRVWDITSGNLVRTIHTGLPEKRNADGEINNELFLSANGAYAFAYNRDGFAPATLWEVATGRRIRRYDLPPSSGSHHTQCAITDDGSKIYANLKDGLYILPGKKP